MKQESNTIEVPQEEETMGDEENEIAEVPDDEEESSESFESGPGSCGNYATYTLTDAGTLTISGEGVIYIDCFKSNKKIKKVVIKSGITSISDNAFAYCTNLTSITIPSSVTSIGKMAFDDCSSLTSITIPSSVTSIGEYAFVYCNSLTSITIPSSVTSIGAYAFHECSRLTNVYYTGSKTQWENIWISSFNSDLTSANITYFGFFAPVISLTYNASAGGNTIKWAKTGIATGYQIYRKAYGESSYTKIKSTTSLSYTDTTAKSDTTYYYKVRPYYEIANGTYIYGEFSSAKSILNGMNKLNGVWGIMSTMSARTATPAWRRTSGAGGISRTVL